MKRHCMQLSHVLPKNNNGDELNTYAYKRTAVPIINYSVSNATINPKTQRSIVSAMIRRMIWHTD